jgi:integral membrane protein
LEGISLLILLFVAMPLKYYFNNPWMVKTVGMAHGLLFLLYSLTLLLVHLQLNWKLRVTLTAFGASFVPFGTFYADKKFFRH